jgi:hypothetical protein
MDMLNHAKERFDKDSDEIRTAEDLMKKELGAAIARLDERSQRVALDGLRTKTVGLLLIALGVLSQGLGGDVLARGMWTERLPLTPLLTPTLIPFASIEFHPVPCFENQCQLIPPQFHRHRHF